MMPASVLLAFTDPVLWATTVPGGRNRVILSLSSHAFRWAIIALQDSGDAASPDWINPSNFTASRAVIDPSPYFLVRSGSIEVVLPLNTLAWTRVFLRPSASIRALTFLIPT